MRTIEVIVKPGTRVSLDPHSYRNNEGVIQISRDYGDTWYNFNQDSVILGDVCYAIIAGSK